VRVCICKVERRDAPPQNYLGQNIGAAVIFFFFERMFFFAFYFNVDQFFGSIQTI